MRYTLFTLIYLLVMVSGYSQEIGYEVQDTYSKPILKEQLDGAKSMIDINPDYPSSWINKEDYISSEVTVVRNGKSIKADGENDVFSAEQRSILKEADFGSNIDIEVKYNLKNSITGNLDSKTMNFSVSLVPETEAEYLGGEEKLKEYLKLSAVDKINASGHNKFEFAKVKFVVDEEGRVAQTQILKTSENEEIDQLLLESIANMPNWRPAQSATGKRVKQEFEFVVGTMMGC